MPDTDPEILETYGPRIAAITRRADSFDVWMPVVSVTDVAELERENAKLREALTQAEARDESRHAFDDLQCFVDDVETRGEYWAEYVRRCNQREALGVS